MLFPTFKGLGWNTVRAASFDTEIQASRGGYEVRLANRTRPRWTWEIQLNILEDSGASGDLRILQAFYLARRGCLEAFEFRDADDATATLQEGRAVTTLTTQLGRSLDGRATAWEPVSVLDGTPQIYVGGTLRTTGFTVGSTGLVTWSTAPGGAVTWSGSYLWRVRFSDDTQTLEQFMSKMWSGKIKLVQVFA